jgi:hypothetical protein
MRHLILVLRQADPERGTLRKSAKRFLERPKHPRERFTVGY